MKKPFYIIWVVVIVVLALFLAVFAAESFLFEPGGDENTANPTATTSDETAATTSGQRSEEEQQAIEDELSDEDTLDLPDDLPQDVAVPEGRDCGVADTTPRSKANADLEALACLGEAIRDCRAAYLTDNEKGTYLSVPEQTQTGQSCQVRLKFRTPDEVTTMETLRTANGELICSLDALERFSAESVHEQVEFDADADNASITVRAALMLLRARGDLLDRDQNEPAEDLIRQNCSGNLVTQTAS